MAVERFVGAMTDAKPSTVDLTGKEFCFAREVAGGFALCGAGQQPVGVISEGKNVGYSSSVKTGNQLKVACGAAVAIGAEVASDANGKAVAAVAGNYVYGRAKKATTAANQMLEIQVTNEGIKA